MFHCWCQDETTRTCNHHTIDSGIEESDTTWTELGLALTTNPAYGVGVAAQKTVQDLLALPQLASRRTEIGDRCIERCREDGNRRAIRFETTYRGEICEECVADPNSSCTEDRGARLAFGEERTEQLIAACEERRSQSLLPVKLAVPIGGVGQVEGLPDYINVAYRYLVTVVLVVAIVMVVYGGFRYLVGASLGDIQAGKRIIVDAIVGMLIVLGAHTILSTINPATTLLSFTPPKPVECRDLDLPEAIKNARCVSDGECGAGRRCVPGVNYVFSVKKVGEAAREGAERGRELGPFVGESVGVAASVLIPGSQLVWDLIPVESRKAASEAAGGVIGGTVGRDIGIATEIVRDVQNIRVCSTGERGSPCLENAHCDLQQNVSCINSWKICWETSGNQPGQPCDSDAQCANGHCDYVAPTTTFCEPRTGECREHPNPQLPYKVCRIDVGDSTPCFIPPGSITVFPIHCNGSFSPGAEFVCAWCPSGSGGVARNWTPLASGMPNPGQCKPRDALGQPCAR